MQDFVRILRSLRDVDGVLGSCIWFQDGALVARDIPSVCGSDVLRGVGGRVLQLYAAFQSGVGGELDAATLTFAQYKLQLARFGPALIGAITSASVNVAALKMALHIALRQIVPMLEAGAQLPADPAQVAVTSPDTTTDAPVRSYRGRRVLG